MIVRDVCGRFVKGHHWRKPQPFRDREWLVQHYHGFGMSAADIAERSGVHENAILYWLNKHDIRRRSISEARRVKHWSLTGSENGMHGRDGKDNPNWRGGVTPERQAFYASQEWKTACSAVWKRDMATCRRCGLRREGVKDGVEFHIHHIASFANEDLRAEVDNLVLLCDGCHHWVHSRENENCDYLSQE